MKKLSEILIESQKTRHQVFDSLVTRSNDNKEITGYCAIGAIGCETGVISSDIPIWLYPSYNTILSKAGVSEKDILKIHTCKKCDQSGYTLSQYIYHMNDAHRMTFKQIGSVLKKMGL